MNATSCENDVGLKIERKHRASVLQLSVAAVMFFCRLLNTAQIHQTPQYSIPIQSNAIILFAYFID